MKGIAIRRHAEARVGCGHPIAGHTAGQAPARSLGPDGFSLWMAELELPAGQALGLPEVHGDEVLYVLAGALRVDSAACPAGGAVVVESGAHPDVVATDGAHVLHMGPTDPRPAGPSLNGPLLRLPDRVHLVGPAGQFAARGPGRHAKYFADSTCDGCRATLLYNARDGSHIAEPHSHSEDELIHLLAGEIRLGAHVVGAGDTLAIAAGRRYGFRSAGGFCFVNYRRDASQHTSVDGHSRMEGGRVNGMHPIGVL